MAGDVPDESRQLACDRRHDLGCMLAGSSQTAELRAQVGLGLPGDGPDVIGQSGIAFPQRSPLPRKIAVLPGGFDQHGAGGGVAGPGEFAAPRPRSTGMLGRNEAQPGHQLFRAVEALQVADLRDQRDGGDEPDPPQCLKRGGDRGQRPIQDRFLKNLLQTRAAFFQFVDAVLVFFIDELRRSLPWPGSRRCGPALP